MITSRPVMHFVRSSPCLIVIIVPMLLLLLLMVAVLFPIGIALPRRMGSIVILVPLLLAQVVSATGLVVIV